MSSHIAAPTHVRYSIFRANLFYDMPVLGKNHLSLLETRRQDKVLKHGIIWSVV